MLEYAVVGSGIGGSSTFTHKGYLYNTGATTFPGYEDELIVKEVLNQNL